MLDRKMPDVGELNLKNLLEHAHIGVIIHQWDTSIVYANPMALKLLRLSYNQIIGKDAFDPQWSFLDEAGKKLPQEEYPVNKVKKSKDFLTNEVIGVIDSSQDEISWFMVNAYFEGIPGDENCFIVVTFNDISANKQLFSFHDIVENTQDVVIVTEAENLNYPYGPKIVYVNQAFQNLTGYTQDEVLGETPRVLQGSLTDEQAKQRIHTALSENQPINETLLNYDSRGRPYWINMSIIPLKNKYGEVTHFAAIERDVSEQKFHLEQLEKRNQDLKVFKKNLESLVEEKTKELRKANAKLEQLAFLDPLTNIPNRRHFIDHATKLINFCNRRKSLIAFGLLDIDNFKSLNDKYGHDIGDAVLIELATLLKKVFRANDAYCRYGGEEFAFLIAIDGEDNIEPFTERLMKKIRELNIPYESDGYIKITVSLGIHVKGADKDCDLETALKKADDAMYQSKNSGKDRVTVTNEK